MFELGEAEATRLGRLVKLGRQTLRRLSGVVPASAENVNEINDLRVVLWRGVVVCHDELVDMTCRFGNSHVS
jgi:hypothetical protein